MYLSKAKYLFKVFALTLCLVGIGALQCHAALNPDLIRVEREVVPVSATGFEINVKIYGAKDGKMARYHDEIPKGFNAWAINRSSGLFNVDDQEVKAIWMEITGEVVQLRYHLEAIRVPKGEYEIDGMFHCWFDGKRYEKGAEANALMFQNHIGLEEETIFKSSLISEAREALEKEEIIAADFHVEGREPENLGTPPTVDQYRWYVRRADILFNEQSFEEAIWVYEKAREYNTVSNYPQRRIAEATHKVYRIAQLNMKDRAIEEDRITDDEALTGVGGFDLEVCIADPRWLQPANAINVDQERKAFKMMLNELKTLELRSGEDGVVDAVKEANEQSEEQDFSSAVENYRKAMFKLAQTEGQTVNDLYTQMQTIKQNMQYKRLIEDMERKQQLYRKDQEVIAARQAKAKAANKQLPAQNSFKGNALAALDKQQPAPRKVIKASSKKPQHTKRPVLGEQVVAKEVETAQEAEVEALAVTEVEEESSIADSKFESTSEINFKERIKDKGLVYLLVVPTHSEVDLHVEFSRMTEPGNLLENMFVSEGKICFRVGDFDYNEEAEYAKLELEKAGFERVEIAAYQNGQLIGLDRAKALEQ